MIKRQASGALKRLAKGFPVVGITGPRQSGKTTLAKAVFGSKPYTTLEDLDTLEFAKKDPRRFLEQFPEGAILDEIQRCPSLFSYLQTRVDEKKKMGGFVLTGSQQFGFHSKITQTLSGRIGLVQLLPFSYEELKKVKKIPSSLDEMLFQGFYPPIYDRKLSPSDWHANYVQTYLERDVRQIIHIRDLSNFQKFLRLCAARIGQLLNLSNLGNECGITHNTANEWLSVLEASYIIFRLQPHFQNFSKRLVKLPKLYFYDSGLASWLLGIQNSKQLSIHPLRAQLFEGWITSELLKNRYNGGKVSNLFFWRDHIGNEVDIIIDAGTELIPIEIKSGATVTTDFMVGLKRWRERAKKTCKRAFLVYGGKENQKRTEADIVSWKNIPSFLKSLPK